MPVGITFDEGFYEIAITFPQAPFVFDFTYEVYYYYSNLEAFKIETLDFSIIFYSLCASTFITPLHDVVLDTIQLGRNASLPLSLIS